LTPRLALTISSAIRIAYGAGSMLAPATMAQSSLAPSIEGSPEPRLLLRAFGGHQLMVAAFSLAALRRDHRLEKLALALNLMIDSFDVASAALEIKPRRGVDSTLAGGIALSGTGAAAALIGLLSLHAEKPGTDAQ
jgi:hypothetical protein